MKILLFSFIFTISLLCSVYAEGLPGITGEMLSSGNVLVNGKANIYGAGKTMPPAPAGGGAGLLPPVIEFSPGEVGQQIMVFPNITGEISCTTPALFNGADGATFCLGETITEPFGGLSGIKADKTMFLVGVFLSDEEAHDPVPSANDYTIYAQADLEAYRELPYNCNFTPELNQIFFIGNGRSGSDGDGSLQYCKVPAKASRLYLGFVDGDDSGLVGYYDDNLGELSVEYEIYRSFEYQNEIETDPPVLTQGLILYYTFEDNEILMGREYLSTNLADSSGFQFHGSISDDAVEFTYEDSKYLKSIKFDNSGSIKVGSDERALPKIDDWTITTWFKWDSEHIVLTISPESYCSQMGCSGPICNHICINPSTFELSTAFLGYGPINYNEGNWYGTSPEYAGSGFYMTDLDKDWHHLAAIGTQGHTDFYIDGEFVGRSPYQCTERIYNIQAWILDDFRLYNRVLSQSEIKMLAEKSTTLPVNIYSDECIATYSNDGTLHIPCLALPESFNDPNIYDVILEQQSNSWSFDLKTNIMVPKKN